MTCMKLEKDGQALWKHRWKRKHVSEGLCRRRTTMAPRGLLISQCDNSIIWPFQKFRYFQQIVPQQPRESFTSTYSNYVGKPLHSRISPIRSLRVSQNFSDVFISATAAAWWHCVVAAASEPSSWSNHVSTAWCRHLASHWSSSRSRGEPHDQKLLDEGRWELVHQSFLGASWMVLLSQVVIPQRRR